MLLDSWSFLYIPLSRTFALPLRFFDVLVMSMFFLLLQFPLLYLVSKFSAEISSYGKRVLTISYWLRHLLCFQNTEWLFNIVIPTLLCFITLLNNQYLYLFCAYCGVLNQIQNSNFSKQLSVYLLTKLYLQQICFSISLLILYFSFKLSKFWYISIYTLQYQDLEILKWNEKKYLILVKVLTKLTLKINGCFEGNHLVYEMKFRQ